MEILGQTSHTVSEVSFKVGFGSTSYFIKCFREHYGYPPGEVGKREEIGNNTGATSTKQRQLVAIMFTDIEGYTSLMQKDEKKGGGGGGGVLAIESGTEKYLTLRPKNIAGVSCSISVMVH